jgi:leader peptidase (prepilin peptidase)/N-methyltransferase
MVAIFIFILGLLLGSFYNVVGLRLPNNESIIYPGSHCPNCNHKLSWYENIPILSYIFLGGKCKSCKKHISFIYPSMEMLTGILFLLSYLYFGISESFFIAIILSSLVVIIFVSDSKYMIILDSPLIICSVLIVIVKVIYEGLKETLFSIGYGVLIFFVVYLLMLLGNYIFKRESLGGGDIKLSFISGLVLGPWLGLFYIVLASFFAFPYAVYITISKKEGMLPFGAILSN